MNKILFSHSYFLRFDPKQWATGQPYAPLGTLYAAALMRANGYQVALFDTMFAHKAEEVIGPVEKEKPAFFVLSFLLGFLISVRYPVTYRGVNEIRQFS